MFAGFKRRNHTTIQPRVDRKRQGAERAACPGQPRLYPSTTFFRLCSRGRRTFCPGLRPKARAGHSLLDARFDFGIRRHIDRHPAIEEIKGKPVFADQWAHFSLQRCNLVSTIHAVNAEHDPAGHNSGKRSAERFRHIAGATASYV